MYFLLVCRVGCYPRPYAPDIFCKGGFVGTWDFFMVNHYFIGNDTKECWLLGRGIVWPYVPEFGMSRFGP